MVPHKGLLQHWRGYRKRTSSLRNGDVHLLKPANFLRNHPTAKTFTIYEMVVSLVELPFAPTRPTATQITADWITITWQPGGGPQVDSYTLYHRAKSSSQWIVIRDIRGRTSMSLKELQPYTTYQFRLFALNDLGTSKPSPLAEFTTSPKGLYFTSIVNALERIRRESSSGISNFIFLSREPNVLLVHYSVLPLFSSAVNHWYHRHGKDLEFKT